MKPYASYKPSGVPWLGDVPAHWEVKQARFVMTCNDDVLPENTSPEQVLDYIEISDVDEVSGVKGFESVKFSEAPSRARRLVMDGDVIVSTVRTYLRAVAAISNPTAETVVSTGFAVLRPRVIDSRYSKYAILYDGFISEVISRSKGISYPAINATDLVRISVPLPPPDEQQAIADYLDVETARIDTLIHEKDELIGLLREWRQSVIAEAVTKGLDKTANFQLHPDPWIGIHPAHWIPKKLKYLGVIRAGAGFPVELQGQTGNPLPFFKVKDIDGANENGIIRESDSTVTPEIALSLGAKVFPPDAIVFAKVGAALLLNRFRLLGKDSCIDNNMMGFMLHHEIANHRFMFWAMQRINFSEIVNPGTVPSLNEPLISNLSIAVPLPDEQQAIADYLDTETAKIDDLIAHTNDEITLLKELRAATIADAVLGRVDVRPATSQ